MKTLISVLVALAISCPAQTVITRFRQITAAAPSGGAPTFVQACDNSTFASAGTGATCVLPSVGAGDVLLIASIGTVSGSGPTVSVNGVELTEPLDEAKSETVRTWIYPNTGSGNNPVVVSQTATGTTRLLVAEFSNVPADPLVDHAVGTCDTGCAYMGSITTPNLTVSTNDLVWGFCKADFGGNNAVFSDTPEPLTNIGQSQGVEYDEAYRVASAAGTTYVQCDQLGTGSVFAIAIKGK